MQLVSYRVNTGVPGLLLLCSSPLDHSHLKCSKECSVRAHAYAIVGSQQLHTIWPNLKL